MTTAPATEKEPPEAERLLGEILKTHTESIEIEIANGDKPEPEILAELASIVETHAERPDQPDPEATEEDPSVPLEADLVSGGQEVEPQGEWMDRMK